VKFHFIGNFREVMLFFVKLTVTQRVWHNSAQTPEMQKQLAKADGAFSHGFDREQIYHHQVIATDEL